VKDNLVVSQVSKRCKRITWDQKLWYKFCTELCGEHLELLDDVNSTDFKKTYISLHNKPPRGLVSFLKLSWILRRLQLTIRDPQFLQLSIHLYSARGTKNEVKQILYLDTKSSTVPDYENELDSGVYNMAFKAFPNQDFPVFFYGEKNIYTSADFVAVGRKFEPREKRILQDVGLQARAPRKSGWHFGSSYSHDHRPLFRLRVFPLSSKQLEKLGVQVTCQRDPGTGHSHRFESAEDTSWRLRSSNSMVMCNVGEVVGFEVCMSVEQLFRAVNPTYTEYTKAANDDDNDVDM